MADSNNVYAAAPPPEGKGVLFRAPLGTALPTDALTDLAVAYKDQGYVGEEGIVNAVARDVAKKKAFGGSTVKTLQNDYTETLRVTLLEDNNLEVLKTAFGEANVTSSGGKTTVKHNKSILPRCVFIVDTIDGETVKRQVAPVGQVTTVGDITQVHTDVVMYTLTIELFEDSNGDNLIEYRESAGS